MLATFELLGYFSGLCGFRIVASRLLSDGTILFTSNTSGEDDVDSFRLLFKAEKKYFGFSIVGESFAVGSS